MDTRRAANPTLSTTAETLLAAYAADLARSQDVRPTTIRNYLSDLRLFVAWIETDHDDGCAAFRSDSVTTAVLTRYRTYLQDERHLKPASVNRSLVSLKRYFGWATQNGHIVHDPARAVKLVGRQESAPRHLSQKEEDALIAAVTTHGSLRDRTLITLMLHTGLRAAEVCHLPRTAIHIVRRSGTLQVVGKGNKYRDVPLNSTVRTALADYLPTLDPTAVYVFPSEKTGDALTERALGHLVAKYAHLAHVPDLSPHDLRHRFGYRMAQSVPLHRLAQIMGHNSLDTTVLYSRATATDLQRDVETIAWT